VSGTGAGIRFRGRGKLAKTGFARAAGPGWGELYLAKATRWPGGHERAGKTRSLICSLGSYAPPAGDPDRRAGPWPRCTCPAAASGWGWLSQAHVSVNCLAGGDIASAERPGSTRAQVQMPPGARAQAAGFMADASRGLDIGGGELARLQPELRGQRQRIQPGAGIRATRSC